MTNTMKDLSTFISEASRSEKKRNEQIAKSIWITGEKNGGVRKFGILTAQNPFGGTESEPDIPENERRQQNKKLVKELLSILKQSNLRYIPIEGRFGGNNETSYMVFNIDLELLTKLSGKFEQTSFFFCKPSGDGDIISQYWQKKDPNLPFDEKENPYELIEETIAWSHLDKNQKDNFSVIGKDFKYTIDMDYFK